MSSQRQQQVAQEIRKSAGAFIATESNRMSLVTPTRVDISPDLKNATIYITVLPEDREEEALNFLKRKRSEFKHYLKKQHLKRLPFVDFVIDYGEKNRQELDKISVNNDM